jgi:uncharacterized protein YbgA (DUF1722 family)/uncharacterized protein YbbK (DUF523 family)
MDMKVGHEFHGAKKHHHRPAVKPSKADGHAQVHILACRFLKRLIFSRHISLGGAMEDQIKLGISACLLGENVRYDGGHKLERFITETLGQYVSFVPVCPEVECGLGVPRESMRLTGEPDQPRLVTTRTLEDHTERMRTWAEGRVRGLEKEDLCGFIFKSDSPSSGMERVKVYNENGMPVKKGVGLFAKAFMLHFPLVPVEEDGRLHDPVLRENFISRVFTLKRWRDILQGKKALGALVTFHTQHKLLIRSHSEKHYTWMGKLLAEGKKTRAPELYARYEKLLMEALGMHATIRKHTNVLQHMMGYFKKQLSSDEKQELLEIIVRYRAGFIPLIVPVTLMNHYVRKYREPYLEKQVYLNPHPVALRLRNHV